MRISIISTHSFPITKEGTVTHTGDVVIADLVRSLDELGHTVYFCAPEGSYCPPNGHALSMRPSFGKYPPSSIDCEMEAYQKHHNIFEQCDIVHDFSVTKCITTSLYHTGHRNVIQTIMGGAWTHDYPPHNLVVWSKSHRDRVLRGATDYEGTSTPDLAGHTGKPVKDAHIVNGGVDTDFYNPSFDKKDYFLWLNRWHPAKGYRLAIEIAKQTGIKLIMSGEHPNNEMFDYQKQCALEAIELAKNCPNITFQYLSKDPDHHTSKRESYQQAKALLYPNDFLEPWGLAMDESLACGTPVIGTNFGSVSEKIENGINGFVCSNIEDFITSIKNIEFVDPKKCRDIAVSKFDRKVMAANYIKEYEKVIKGESW